MSQDQIGSLQQHLRDLLREVMRAGDRPLVAAVRTVLGELANAEAVDASDTLPAGNTHFAGSQAGLAATETPRRDLDPIEQQGILRAEVAELRASAELNDGAGRKAQATDLRRAADRLEQLTDPSL